MANVIPGSWLPKYQLSTMPIKVALADRKKVVKLDPFSWAGAVVWAGAVQGQVAGAWAGAVQG